MVRRFCCLNTGNRSIRVQEQRDLRRVLCVGGGITQEKKEKKYGKGEGKQERRARILTSGKERKNVSQAEGRTKTQICWKKKEKSCFSCNSGKRQVNKKQELRFIGGKKNKEKLVQRSNLFKTLKKSRLARL